MASVMAPILFGNTRNYLYLGARALDVGALLTQIRM